MKNLKKNLILVVILVCGISATSNGQKAKPWEVPAKFKAMENPVKSDEASIKAGQLIYNKNCAACHGKTGLGDGPKSKGLKTAMNSFARPEYQNQADGELFYKTKTGRGEMTKFEGKLSDNDIWNAVNYTRTLRK